MRYHVLKDTREQKGWTFEETNKCEGTTIEGLKTGDYTLKGFEHSLCVERKGSVIEWAHNCIEPRFIKELERMITFKYRFIILEFTMKDMLNYPNNVNLPAQIVAKLKMDGEMLLKKTLEFQIRYNVHIIFAGTEGKKVTQSIFKRVTECKS